MRRDDRAARGRPAPEPLARFEAVVDFESSERVRRSLGHVRRLLATIHELHKLGYQGVRISPGRSPSGAHWRCAVAAAPNFRRDGWSLVSDSCAVHYSSADGPRFFGWDDAPGKRPSHLARMFVERFPRLASDSIGMDYPYAGWFAAALGAVEHGRLPVFYADYKLNLSGLDMPPPPPGRWPPAR
ncbi:MAG: hypothetical protein OXI22_19760 [Defluviicoccus sp.]|nr:hypothetical protein [Defluviicoccus sp.]MDE0386126.1 hypothetical protein [Defluviicoccus sp.]